MRPKTTVFLLLVAWITGSTLAQSTKCPQKGKIGAPLPDVFQGINPSDGYDIHIELTGGAHTFTEVEDYYNGATRHGRIQINDEDGLKEIYYYSMTNEAFTVNKDKKCEANQLDVTEKVSIVNSWLKSEDFIKALTTSLQGYNLGPGALLMYVNSIKDKVQEVSGNPATIDGQQAKQWFYCVTDTGPYIDFNFDTKNQPINMVLSFPGRPDITHTINFVSMEPVIPQKVEPIPYPWGFGCIRPMNTSTVVVPTFAEKHAFMMEIEAALFLSSADVSVLQNAKVAKYQGIYAYDLISGNQTTRIIHDSIVAVDYLVDPMSGKCTEQPSRMAENSHMTYLRWPYTEEEMFNLLDDKLLKLGSVEYMGQTDTEFGRMDVFEKIEANFFVNDDKEPYDGLITYFFPVMETVKERHQAPQKIIIKPLQGNKDLNDPSFVTKIELMFIDYREENMDYNDLFDVSGCYDEPGRYTWFQIVFSDIEAYITSYAKEEELIRTQFDKLISSLIPRIRLPETRITFFGPNIYITCKLLERPAFKYFFHSYLDTIIENPTKILIREHEEDCGEVCSKDKKCVGFSYCSNRECRILSSATEFPKFESQVGCTEYAHTSFLNDAASTVEKNLMESSKTILHEMKVLIESGLFRLESPEVSAEDMFIVSGPDVIGGYNDEFTEDEEVPSGDLFSVNLIDHRLNEGYKFLGVTYQQCLTNCADYDGCLLLSYCPNRDGGECILSYPPPEGSKDSAKPDYPLSTGCNILSKDFTSFFRKLPGRSLVVSSKETLKNIPLEDCAIRCELSTTFTCESFDYCPSLLNNEDKKSEPTCFLHTFHVAKDVSSEINGTVWNFATGECDHYSRKHSQDYKQYIGRRLKVNLDLILGQADDVPLEHCAINCESEGDGCKSFEYCEVPAKGSRQAKTTCRYSKLRPLTGKDKDLELSTDLCSVYVTKNNIQKATSSETSKSGLGLAMGLGPFMMIAGFAAAVIGSHFYIKRRQASSS